MSNDKAEEADDVCASCGITAGDDIKLKKCTACKHVQYCSVLCQKEHRPQHKRACKRWAAELRDEILFKQPESTHFGDCPICFLPLSYDVDNMSISSCCSKMICDGCVHAERLRQEKEGLPNKCPFCRHLTPATQAKSDMDVMKRVESNDPVAIREVGLKYMVREKNCSKALECWTKAAELGDIEAHYLISNMYALGHGVEKDEKKAVYYSEIAAIGGHPRARYNLAVIDVQSGRFERAHKHLIIAASLGYEGALDYLKTGFKNGYVSKEDFEAALRGYQAAIEATKSPQRTAAKEAEYI